MLKFKKCHFPPTAFGLIEVLISATIISISLFGIAAITTRSMNAATDSSYREAANQLIAQLGKFILAIENPSQTLPALVNSAVTTKNNNCYATADSATSPSGCGLQEFYRDLVFDWKNSVTQILPNGTGCTCWINNSSATALVDRKITIRVGISWTGLTGSRKSTNVEYPMQVAQAVTPGEGVTVQVCDDSC